MTATHYWWVVIHRKTHVVVRLMLWNPCFRTCIVALNTPRARIHLCDCFICSQIWPKINCFTTFSYDSRIKKKTRLYGSVVASRDTVQEVHIYRIDASGHGFQQNRPISRYTRDTALRAVFGHPVMKLSTCGVLVVDFLESWSSHVPLTRIKCLKSLI